MNMSYADSSTACNFHTKFSYGRHRDKFCIVSFIRKVKKAATDIRDWGSDDTMFTFEDGSMLLWRNVVKEFQLFK